MMVETLIGKTIVFLNNMQMAHWQTKSYAEHEALGEYYNKLNVLNDNESLAKIKASELAAEKIGYKGAIPVDLDDKTLFKIAKVFNMSVEQLMEEVRDGCRQIDEMQGTHQPEDLIKSVGLKEWLIKNEKSQCWLSKSLKVSQPTISRWLKGQTTPLVHQAFEIEKITNGQVNCNSWGIN